MASQAISRSAKDAFAASVLRQRDLKDSEPHLYARML